MLPLSLSLTGINRSSLFLVILLILIPFASSAQQKDTLFITLDMTTALEAGWLDTGNETVGIRGDHRPLSWGTTYPAIPTEKEGIYEVAIPFELSGSSMQVFYKIKADGVNNPEDGWQQGNNHSVTLQKGSNATVRLAWEDRPAPLKSTITGTVEVFEGFDSDPLLNRNLYIYLPPDYQKSDKRYPVLYMHDGQMLFDASVNGQEWKLDEAAEKLIKAGVIEPLIIVGIGNTANRMEEYTPTRQVWHFELKRVSPPTSEGKWGDITGDFAVESGEAIRIKSQNDTLMTQIPGSEFWQPLLPKTDSTFFIPRAGITLTFYKEYGKPAHRLSADKPSMGGDGKLYGEFILKKVKPFIDENLRTKPGKETTGLGGSSLGGLITMYLGLEYPDTFGKLLVVSPSVWWDQRYILKAVEKLEAPTGQPVWLYMGTAEGNAAVENVKLLHETLLESGWSSDEVELVITPDAAHNETAWSQQAEAMLKFMFPKEP